MRVIYLLTVVSLCVAQSFDAATIKPSRGGGGPFTQIRPGKLSIEYASVQDIVAYAYDIRPEQIVGANAKDHYDIEAAGDEQNVIPMLRNLLADRFHLKLHRETRQLPLYELTVAKSGTKLHTAIPGACTPFVPSAGPVVRPASTWCDIAYSGARGLTRTITAKALRMETLAVSLSRTELNRPVLNKTGLTGAYDVNFTWSVDPSIPGLDDNKGGTRGPNSPPGANIFNALQEQLGLKLDSARGPVEVIVVDAQTPPSDN